MTDGTPDIVVEFPDFGFGPASSAVEVVRRIGERRRCLLVSTGSALEFAQRSLPLVPTADLDTFSSAGLAGLAQHVGKEKFVLSVTNPPFAHWAEKEGYRVGVLDTLHWLWDSSSDAPGRPRFYVAQDYWGPAGANVPVNTVFGRADDAFLPAARPSRRALVTFGGMTLPFDDALPLEFARWALRSVVPVLLRSPEIEGVDVVGGHPNLGSACVSWLHDERVRFVGMMSLDEHRAAIASATVVVATPGIATIHELQRAARPAVLMPGFNASQVLQLRDAVERYGCPYALEWPAVRSGAAALRRLPESEAVAMVARIARHEMLRSAPRRALGTLVARALAADEPARPLGAEPWSRDRPQVGELVAELMERELSLPVAA
ncbi:MAG TPA: hypothetical protein VF529_15715 [Solirubrobacteraceae bacterium]|jgi:hypothetical protein